MNVLVLDCASTSVAFAVIDASSGLERISGVARCLGCPDGDWKIDGQTHTTHLDDTTLDGALRVIAQLLGEVRAIASLAGVGHRVVHGGVDPLGFAMASR